MFWELQITLDFCLFVSIAFMVFDSALVNILIIPTVLVGCLIVAQFIIMRECIFIDAEGIACRKGKMLLWQFKWLEIAELRLGNRFRNSSVEIVVKTEYIKQSTETINTYFQLGLSAKKAINEYCPRLFRELKQQGKVPPVL